jgi:NAD(P)-dependent dehydrogenase (short-subunit alcohol dehydrogenase family)
MVQPEPGPGPESQAASEGGGAHAVAADVAGQVLALVAETTGYPEDMLDLELDMEADLGVDTVKQAEIFATIRETYDIPRDETLKLREFPTLAHVIQFVKDRAPALAGARAAAAETAPEAHTAEAVPEPVAEPPVRPEAPDLSAADRVPRRVPIPSLRPPFSICKHTGISLGQDTRVLVMSDRGGIGPVLVERLREFGVSPLVVGDQPDAETLAGRIDAWLSEGPINGIYWLPALDAEPAWDSIDLATWKELLRIRVKLLFTTMRTLALAESVPQFLVTATRLGGLHGYDQAGAVEPMGGAVTGFTKACQRELDGALVKAVDFDGEAGAEEIVGALVNETLLDPGAVEVGHQNGIRWSVGLEERSAADGTEGMRLGPDSVFVITGAAGSIVSAIVADLASASGGTFHLLDLAPEPDPADPDISQFDTDRDGLKRTIAQRLKERGERPTPVMVERQLAALERARAALSAIRAIEASGGVARYHQVDLTDPVAVRGVIEKVRQENGRIDVMLHAAGLEISHFLAGKEPREFELVFDVKTVGWFNLLSAIGSMPLGATVAFSSIAGRFGNGGQTDYSAANDLLCKSSSNFRTTRPGTRGIAIDWTAWAGIGMASRGSIPKMMEVAGIDMLPPEVGVPVIRRELTAGGGRGEIVIGGRLGILTQERDEAGGVDAVAGQATVGTPVAGRVESLRIMDGLTVETTLDPQKEPFLNDHRIEGTAVLPGVMGVEAFAEAAQTVLPGWHVLAVEDMHFEAPFKFYRNESRTVAVRATFRLEGDEVVAECRLIGTRLLAGQSEPQVTEHFRGRVRLGRVAPMLERAAADAELPTETHRGPGPVAEDIYRVFFHGPAYQVLDRVEVTQSGAVGTMAHDLPPDLGVPGTLVMSPRLIELCFQTAGVWELSGPGRFGLPRSVDRIVVGTSTASPTEPVRALVTARDNGGAFDAVVLGGDGLPLVQLHGYRTVELPGAVDPEAIRLLASA